MLRTFFSTIFGGTKNGPIQNNGLCNANDISKTIDQLLNLAPEAAKSITKKALEIFLQNLVGKDCQYGRDKLPARFEVSNYYSETNGKSDIQVRGFLTLKIGARQNNDRACKEHDYYYFIWDESLNEIKVARVSSNSEDWYLNTHFDNLWKSILRENHLRERQCIGKEVETLGIKTSDVVSIVSFSNEDRY